jgi:hypothetical protein
MAGIYLGGKHTKSLTVDFFLLLNDYRYNYIYSRKSHLYRQGAKSYCSTNGMVHAAPLKLVSWEW